MAAAVLVVGCAAVEAGGLVGDGGWSAPQAEAITTQATTMMEAMRDPGRAARRRVARAGRLVGLADAGAPGFNDGARSVHDFLRWLDDLLASTLAPQNKDQPACCTVA